MLNSAEELILLAIDDESGAFYRMANISFNLALIGALLMDLALKNRIDVDMQHLFILNKEKTGDLFLDDVLSAIASPQASGDTANLVRQLFYSQENLRDRLLQSLEDKGIIKVEESKVLWLFKHRRYPVIDNTEEQEVLSRIRETVTTDIIPEPKDIALISLLYTCDLMDKIFSKDELRQHQTRIETLQKMELISHSVNRIIGELQVMMNSTFST